MTSDSTIRSITITLKRLSSNFLGGCTNGNHVNLFQSVSFLPGRLVAWTTRIKIGFCLELIGVGVGVGVGVVG